MMSVSVQNESKDDKPSSLENFEFTFSAILESGSSHIEADVSCQPRFGHTSTLP